MVDLEEYMSGKCHLLALALCMKTDWEMYGLYTERDSYAVPEHVFCKTPDGRYLDIQGLHTDKEMHERYDQGFESIIKPIDEWELNRLIEEGSLCQIPAQEMRVALSVATYVLNITAVGHGVSQ